MNQRLQKLFQTTVGWKVNFRKAREAVADLHDRIFAEMLPRGVVFTGGLIVCVAILVQADDISGDTGQVIGNALGVVMAVLAAQWVADHKQRQERRSVALLLIEELKSLSVYVADIQNTASNGIAFFCINASSAIESVNAAEQSLVDMKSHGVPAVLMATSQIKFLAAQRKTRDLISAYENLVPHLSTFHSLERLKQDSFYSNIKMHADIAMESINDSIATLGGE